MNADKLSGNLPERLNAFLSRREVSSSGVQLHLIQCETSLLHSGPWVEGLTWDQASLQTFFSKDSVGVEAWKSLIVDNKCLTDVSILWTPTSGTGKTRFIRLKNQRPPLY